MKPGKIKVGTVLDSDTYLSLKQVAAKQNRRISDLLHVAITRFLAEPPEEAGRRWNTLRLISSGMQTPGKDLLEIVELDYYEQ